jgi:hypothetical protein
MPKTIKKEIGVVSITLEADCEYSFNKNKNKKEIEEIFNISLKNRKYELIIKPKWTMISFYDKKGIFGYTARIKTEKFLLKLAKKKIFIEI